jgi:membrane protein
MKKVLIILAAALRKYLDDSGPIYTAGIAYAALVAAFPLLLLVLVLASLLFPAMDVVRITSNLLQIPGLGDFLSRNILAVYENRATLGISGGLGIVCGAICVFAAVQDALNRVWQVQKRRWIVRQFITILAVGVFTFSLIVLLATLILALRTLRHSLTGAGLVSPDVPTLLAFIAPPLVNSALFFVAYKALPNTRVPTRAALKGALVAALLAQIVFVALTFYIESIADYSRLYNTAGAVFALLLWLYTYAAVFLLGAEVSAVLGKE